MAEWFSISGVTEENRAARVAEAMPDLHALVKHAQDRFGVLQSDTALIGFSQGAIMVLEFSIAHDGGVGRVLAFSGRFARLPDHAPELTTLHCCTERETRLFLSPMRRLRLPGLRNWVEMPRWISPPRWATRSTRNWPTMPFAACRPIYPCAAGRRQWMALDAKQV